VNIEGFVMSVLTTRYSTVAVILHWLIAVLMIYMVLFGEDLIRRPTETFYPSLHASIGISVLILSLARLVWRLMNPPPALPSTMKAWEVTVSHITHWAFYILMIGLPLTGLMAFTHMLPKEAILSGTTLFGVAPVPGLPDLGGAGSNLHELGSKALEALIILHVVAALKHQFWDKDNLLRSMSPH
jgi:cytochrome b561